MLPLHNMNRTFFGNNIATIIEYIILFDILA